MTFISYISIYIALVVYRSYSLIPVYFLSYMSLFFLFQLLAIFLITFIKYLLKSNNQDQNINLILQNHKYTLFIFLLGNILLFFFSYFQLF